MDIHQGKCVRSSHNLWSLPALHLKILQMVKNLKNAAHTSTNYWHIPSEACIFYLVTLAHKADGDESPKVISFQPCLASNEEGDFHISCHLNLSLASSSLPVSNSSIKMVHVAEETGKYSVTRSKIDGYEADLSVPSKNRNVSAGDATSAENNKHVPASAPARVNDGFWEQFLTERPGSSDTEEASSNYRANSYDEPEARKLDQGISRNIKSAQHLSL